GSTRRRSTTPRRWSNRGRTPAWPVSSRERVPSAAPPFLNHPAHGQLLPECRPSLVADSEHFMDEYRDVTRLTRLGRDEHRNGLAAIRDQDLLTPGDATEQFRQVRLGLKRSDAGHRRSPFIWFIKLV